MFDRKTLRSSLLTAATLVATLAPVAHAEDASELESSQAFATRCAGCHGADARGTRVAPSLIGVSRTTIQTVVRQGRPKGSFAVAMPAFPASSLSDQDLLSIMTYLGAP